MTKRLTAGMDEHEQKLLRDIEECGLHVMLIREQKGLPGWAFSIGFYEKYRHPEIVLFGLPGDVMQRILNGIAEDIKQGREFKPGFEYDGIIERFRCIFHSVQQGWYPPFLGWATWYYEGDNFPVLQCFWPDKEQRYPWSDRFPEQVRFQQPFLFRWGVDEARAESLLRSIWETNVVDEIVEITSLGKTADSFTSACKHHRYDPNFWPFENPKRIHVIVPRQVVDGALFISNVFHDESDTWLIYPRTTEGLKEQPVEACMGCLYARDATLADIADLPRNWEARRNAPEDPWVRAVVPDE